MTNRRGRRHLLICFSFLALASATACSSDNPHISSVSPTTVTQGGQITIDGTGFCGANDSCAEAEIDIQIGTASPYFNAQPQTETATQLQAIIPTDVGTGATQLVVTVNGQSSNGVNITIESLSD